MITFPYSEKHMLKVLYNLLCFSDLFLFSKTLFLEQCADKDEYFYCDFHWELPICPVSDLNIKQIILNRIIPRSEQ